MKLLLVIFSIFVAVCYSQTPARPVIPETFVASVDVELRMHAEEIAFGGGRIARDEAKGWGVEDTWLMEGNFNVSQLRLERYDMGMIFRLKSTERQCEVRNVSGSLPPYFKWGCSTYAGKVKVREYIYDEWTLPGPGGRFDIYVDSDMPNVPHYVNAEVSFTTRKALYRDFNAVTPSSSMFAIPKECQPNLM